MVSGHIIVSYHDLSITSRKRRPFFRLSEWFPLLPDVFQMAPSLSLRDVCYSSSNSKKSLPSFNKELEGKEKENAIKVHFSENVYGRLSEIQSENWKEISPLL